MGKYQEKIIELISDYMDKTLSEGLLLLDERCSNPDDPYWKIIKVLSSEPGEAYGIEMIPLTYNDVGNSVEGIVGYSWRDDLLEYSIVGHYDITAVLKYIIKNGLFIDFTMDRLQIIITDSQDNIFLEIPNKPLHLYTEKQNKELVEFMENILANN